MFGTELCENKVLSIEEEIWTVCRCSTVYVSDLNVRKKQNAMEGLEASLCNTQQEDDMNHDRKITEWV